MKQNLKLTLSRIFTGSVFQQFVLMALIVFAFIVVCFLGWTIFGVRGIWRDIVECFLNPCYSWDGWQESHGERSFRPIVGFLGTIFFSGTLVAILTNGIKNYREKIQAGEVEYNLKDHVVIIGFDDVVPGLIRQIVRSSKYEDSLILIHSSNPLEHVKDQIHSKLLDSEEKRVIYMHSLFPSKEELCKLHTIDAREIFVVGDRTQHEHDSGNMHIIRILSELHEDANAKCKPMTVWFEQETSYAALQLNNVKQAWNNQFEFTPFNFYKDWANRLLTSSHYHRGKDIIRYPEMDHKGITVDADKHVHLVIIGMNRMGVAVAKEAAHLLHFPNFDEKTLANQTVITFIDDHADKEMLFLQGRHPGYFEIAPTHYCDVTNPDTHKVKFEIDDSLVKIKPNFLDVKFEFIKGRVESPTIRNWLVAQAKDPKQYLSVIVCLHNPSKSLGSGLYLPEELYKEYGEDHYTNVFIRQEISSSMVESLRKAATEGENKRYAHIYPFGMLKNSLDLDCLDTTMAQALSYIYDYYFEHSELLPLSLPSRKELSERWQNVSISHQWSNIYLADSFEFKLRSIGYDIYSGKPLIISDKDQDSLARVEHNRWNMEKLLIGYRALHKDEWAEADNYKQESERKDYLNNLKNKLFVHQHIVPNAQLTPNVQVLDKNIIETLPMVIAYSKKQ